MPSKPRASEPARQPGSKSAGKRNVSQPTASSSSSSAKFYTTAKGVKVQSKQGVHGHDSKVLEVTIPQQQTKKTRKSSKRRNPIVALVTLLPLVLLASLFSTVLCPPPASEPNSFSKYALRSLGLGKKHDHHSLHQTLCYPANQYYTHVLEPYVYPAIEDVRSKVHSHPTYKQHIEPHYHRTKDAATRVWNGPVKPVVDRVSRGANKLYRQYIAPHIPYVKAKFIEATAPLTLHAKNQYNTHLSHHVKAGKHHACAGFKSLKGHYNTASQHHFTAQAKKHACHAYRVGKQNLHKAYVYSKPRVEYAYHEANYHFHKTVLPKTCEAVRNISEFVASTWRLIKAHAKLFYNDHLAEHVGPHVKKFKAAVQPYCKTFDEKVYTPYVAPAVAAVAPHAKQVNKDFWQLISDLVPGVGNIAESRGSTLRDRVQDKKLNWQAMQEAKKQQADASKAAKEAKKSVESAASVAQKSAESAASVAKKSASSAATQVSKATVQAKKDAKTAASVAESYASDASKRAKATASSVESEASASAVSAGEKASASAVSAGEKASASAVSAGEKASASAVSAGEKASASAVSAGEKASASAVSAGEKASASAVSAGEKASASAVSAGEKASASAVSAGEKASASAVSAGEKASASAVSAGEKASASAVSAGEKASASAVSAGEKASASAVSAGEKASASAVSAGEKASASAVSAGEKASASAVSAGEKASASAVSAGEKASASAVSAGEKASASAVSAGEKASASAVSAGEKASASAVSAGEKASASAVSAGEKASASAVSAGEKASASAVSAGEKASASAVSAGEKASASAVSAGEKASASAVSAGEKASASAVSAGEKASASAVSAGEKASASAVSAGEKASASAVSAGEKASASAVSAGEKASASAVSAGEKASASAVSAGEKASASAVSAGEKASASAVSAGEKASASAASAKQDAKSATQQVKKATDTATKATATATATVVVADEPGAQKVIAKEDVETDHGAVADQLSALKKKIDNTGRNVYGKVQSELVKAYQKFIDHDIPERQAIGVQSLDREITRMFNGLDRLYSNSKTLTRDQVAESVRMSDAKVSKVLQTVRHGVASYQDRIADPAKGAIDSAKAELNKLEHEVESLGKRLTAKADTSNREWAGYKGLKRDVESWKNKIETSEPGKKLKEVQQKAKVAIAEVQTEFDEMFGGWREHRDRIRQVALDRIEARETVAKEKGKANTATIQK
ncbi:hypothetical protein A1Q2_02755 [Trichosporon asahii var. asahii CBS 8904]|uniref:Uncharacterized protein n=1 Tax=Trichosporon asahii var. asahii (strain CBS 8904) TaxID=1220162 RepID=K1WPD3_TRIAC|nr:hypothetical protein A1Q2_02755 [Trichosporon asahii var. asahii CBS 8904]